ESLSISDNPKDEGGGGGNDHPGFAAQHDAGCATVDGNGNIQVPLAADRGNNPLNYPPCSFLANRGSGGTKPGFGMHMMDSGGGGLTDNTTGGFGATSGLVRGKNGGGGSAVVTSLPKIFKYKDWESLPSENVGIDDEVLRTSMAMYQPKFRLDLDFLNDRSARNQYLDQAKTLRGVTVLAMGFLDKTLGAGLTDIQAQADANTTSEIMRQVNWSLERLATPERANVYRDIDEKLESCLELALNEKPITARIKGDTYKRVEFQCDRERCGQPPSSEKKYSPKSETDYSRHGNGTYRYCLCCASTDQDLNMLGDGQNRKPTKLISNERVWTAVERAFLGTSHEINSEQLNKYIEIFKLLFGDVVIKKIPEQNSSNTESTLRYVTQTSKMAPLEFVSMVRNRCKKNDPSQKDLGLEGNCGVDEDKLFNIKLGACPALYNILKNWDSISQGGGKDILRDNLPEATVGLRITGSIVEAIIIASSQTENQVSQEDQKLAVAEAISAICDASALAGATRHLVYIKSAAEELMALNNQVRQRDKAIVRQLIERYFDHLRYDQIDKQSKYELRAVITGLEMNKDRIKSAINASVVQAAQNLANNRSNLSALSSFSASGLIASIGGGGGGGAAGLKRSEQLSSVTKAFGPVVGQTFEEAVVDLERSGNLDPAEGNIGARISKLLRRN
ncbi:MAG TPA: hypothetical protein PJ989_07375, partial [Oligoflexia bacterium]|nr:hypothetical protein [Oligoflexia bacterium]